MTGETMLSAENSDQGSARPKPHCDSLQTSPRSLADVRGLAVSSKIYTPDRGRPSALILGPSASPAVFSSP